MGVGAVGDRETSRLTIFGIALRKVSCLVPASLQECGDRQQQQPRSKSSASPMAYRFAGKPAVPGVAVRDPGGNMMVAQTTKVFHLRCFKFNRWHHEDEKPPVGFW